MDEPIDPREPFLDDEHPDELLSILEDSGCTPEEINAYMEVNHDNPTNK